MTLDYDSMYDSVQLSIAKQDSKNSRNSGAYREVLKLQVGGKYVFRVVPYQKDGIENVFNKTFFRYVQYNWQHMTVDPKTGKPRAKWEFILSPSTFGERCPISEFRNNYRRSATKEELDTLNNKLSRREGHLINVFVIKDSTNSENEGKVKILDCPKTVWNMIDGTLRGDYDEQYSELLGEEVHLGKRIMNLTNDGINLSLTVGADTTRKTPKGNPMPDYSKASWQVKGGAQNWDEDKQKEILNTAYDLATVNRVLPVDEVDNIFKTTFLPKIGVSAESLPKVEAETPTPKVVVESVPTPSPTPAPEAENSGAVGEVDTVGDVDDFLRELDL